MLSDSLGEMVKHVFGDQQVKEQFLASPDDVISRYNLTEQEKQAVMTAHCKMVAAGNSPSAPTMDISPLAMWV